MKKVTAIILAVLLTAAIFAGCSSDGGAVKTGFAVISTIAKSTDATADKAGLAEADSVLVAVTVDGAGKIVKCVIDSIQTKVNFSNTGKITTPLTTEVKTKNELGTEYGMKKASKLGKEWNEQAAALANYVVGKTVAEVKAIAVDDTKHPTGADLKSSVTMSIGDYIAGIEKAVANATDIGSKKTDKLGVDASTNIAKSTDATADKAGLAQAYSIYAVTTTDASGKITACILDGSQTNVNFTTAGKITTALTATFKTKNELGTEYGMKKVSKIGKEWNEQAAAFAKYVIGKTSAQVAGITMDATKHATGTDLTSSVTVTVGDFITNIQAAIASAK